MKAAKPLIDAFQLVFHFAEPFRSGHSISLDSGRDVSDPFLDVLSLRWPRCAAWLSLNISDPTVQPTLPFGTSAALTPTATYASPAENGKTTTSAASLSLVKGESYWRNKKTQLQSQLLEHEQSRAFLSSRMDVLRANVNTAIDRNRLADGRATIYGQSEANPAGTELARLQTEQELLTAKIVTDKKLIADLEEDRRRAGALPGWFR